MVSSQPSISSVIVAPKDEAPKEPEVPAVPEAPKEQAPMKIYVLGLPRTTKNVEIKEMFANYPVECKLVKFKSMGEQLFGQLLLSDRSLFPQLKQEFSNYKFKDRPIKLSHVSIMLHVFTQLYVNVTFLVVFVVVILPFLASAKCTWPQWRHSTATTAEASCYRDDETQKREGTGGREQTNE